MLEEVGKLGVPHRVAEEPTGVTHAHVVCQLGHEMEDAGRGLDVLAGHERGIGGDLHEGIEVPRPYRDLFDFHELGHRAAPLLFAPACADRRSGLIRSRLHCS